LADEVELIERARAALESGDVTGALALTDAHAKSFPRGELVPDRLNLAAAALCRSGRVPEGRELLHTLRRKWPHAPVTRRARTSCQGD
jgi:hypothetical protein